MITHSYPLTATTELRLIPFASEHVYDVMVNFEFDLIDIRTSKTSESSQILAISSIAKPTPKSLIIKVASENLQLSFSSLCLRYSVH